MLTWLDSDDEEEGEKQVTTRVIKNRSKVSLSNPSSGRQFGQISATRSQTIRSVDPESQVARNPRFKILCKKLLSRYNLQVQPQSNVKKREGM